MGFRTNIDSSKKIRRSSIAMLTTPLYRILLDWTGLDGYRNTNSWNPGVQPIQVQFSAHRVTDIVLPIDAVTICDTRVGVAFDSAWVQQQYIFEKLFGWLGNYFHNREMTE